MGNILNGVTFDNIMYVGGDKTIRAGKIFTGLMGSWRHSSNRLKNIVWLVENSNLKIILYCLIVCRSKDLMTSSKADPVRNIIYYKYMYSCICMTFLFYGTVDFRTLKNRWKSWHDYFNEHFSDIERENHCFVCASCSILLMMLWNYRFVA